MVLNVADNLSKAMEGSSVSAIEGRNLMKMTVTALQSVRSEESFHFFWHKTEKKWQNLECEILPPTIPRKCSVPA